MITLDATAALAFFLLGFAIGALVVVMLLEVEAWLRGRG